jgi:microcystin-dependent protein
MANIKYSPSLFLEAIELQRSKEFSDIEFIDSTTKLAAIGGFRKNILENSVSFGLVKSNKDTSFLNGLVQPDIDVVVGPTTFKSIKIKPLYAIDSNGQFIYQAQKSSITIPSDSSWYWVRVTHQFSNQEKGTFSLATDGTLSGTGGEFTKILRGGQNNFASKIKLLNSSLNTLEYEVLEVIDDNNCILLGTSFAAETNLTLGIVGTFTPGVSPASGDKMIFQYDSCLLELISETATNSPPAATAGIMFFLSRVKSDGTTLIVQDKRLNYWETKGSNLAIDIDKNTTPFAGVEAVKFMNALTPADENIIQISWGLRADNWTINTNTNTVTLTGSVRGGIYNTITSIPDNIFNGWRVYTSNGKYSRIITSTKSGSSMNLVLDVLDINNYFTGGDADNTFIIPQTLLVVPNAEEIQLELLPTPAADLPSETRVYTFPINTFVGDCKVLAYNNSGVGLYNIKYRFKNLKEYTTYITIPTNPLGYYNEASFDANGNLTGSPTLVPYVGNNTLGFIQVNLSPDAYSRFVNKVDKGDIIGVTSINTLSTATYDLLVGTNNNYLKLIGDIVLTADTVIRLNTTGAVNGNEFRIQLDYNSLTFAGHTLQIVQGNGISTSIVKNITAAESYILQNMDGGIIFDAVFDGTNWNVTQNYDPGVPFETKILSRSGVLTNFDSGSGLGNAKGYFGYSIADSRNGTDDLTAAFVVGYDPSDTDYNAIGNTGGEKEHTLTDAETPLKDHQHYSMSVDVYTSGGADLAAGQYGVTELNAGIQRDYSIQSTGSTPNALKSSSPIGGAVTPDAFGIVPPYYTVLYIQKLY